MAAMAALVNIMLRRLVAAILVASFVWNGPWLWIRKLPLPPRRHNFRGSCGSTSSSISCIRASVSPIFIASSSLVKTSG
uniref:Putative secreted protein n=1 Tax=Anopheles darlingi TaxID=43151 RepID=A0A2M4DRC4_ANODA